VTAPAMSAIGIHPAAELFPAMEAAEFGELVEDVRARGLLEPIVLYGGAVLDGRHRYRACLEAGVEPRFETYEGDDPLGYVTARNLRRRHLSANQRALIAARLANLPLGTNRHTRRSAPGRIYAQPEAAAALQVSERSVQRARRVLREAPQLAAAIERGETTVKQAEAQIAGRPPGVAKTRAAVAERRVAVRELTERGHLMADIAERLGIGPEAVRRHAAAAGVVTVDAKLGKLRRIDPNRVAKGIVDGAIVPEPLLELIEGHYDDLPPASLTEWIDSLGKSITVLTRFRNRLKGVRG